MCPLGKCLNDHKSYQEGYDAEQAWGISKGYMLIDRNLDEIGPRWSKNSQSYRQDNQKIELLLVGLYIGVQLAQNCHV